MKTQRNPCGPAIKENGDECQRCVRGEEATYRVRSDVIDMKVCAACANEARRLGLTVEVLDDGEKRGNGGKSEIDVGDYRSELLPDCGR